MLDIRLWGNPHAFLAGRPFDVRVPPACWSLLALIAVERQPMVRASVAEQLWPDATDSEALANLRRHIHRLNQALPGDGGPWLLADARTVGWNHESQATIDVLEFLRLLALRRDEEAVEAYAGDLLGTSFDEAIVGLRERLRASYLDTLDRLMRRTYAEGDLAGALRFAELLLAAEEWREDAVRSVMAIRYERGDRSGAISAYERFAETLRRELRTAPMPETIALRDAILSGAPLPQSVPKVRGADPELGARFVGRKEELRTLRGAWEKAARGRGTTMLLSGEPGIGKSRLALELGAIVESQGGCALIGRTSSPEAAAFQPVIEALRDGLPLLARGDLEDGWLAALSSVLPEVARLSDNVSPFDESENERRDPVRARARLREGMVRAIAAIARRRPLLMVLEDVHWAGRETIDFIEMLANRAAALPMLLVLTYRPGDIDPKHPLHVVCRELQHARRAQVVAPPRLGKLELAELARAFLGQERPTQELVERLEQTSEGNPLFAVQVLRYVAETGDLPGAERALQSIAATVISRLERLAPEARAIAEVAATIDSDFTSEEIARVGGWEEATVLAALGVLLDARIVCERGGERFAYGFTHALIQSAIRDAAKQAEQRPRHFRIAQVLAATRATDPAAPALIAAHWEAANETKRAALALLQAARVEMQRYAWNEAIVHAKKAVAFGLDDAEKFTALRATVDASLRLADTLSVSTEIDEMDRLAENLGIEERLTALLLRARCADFATDRPAQRRAIERLAETARETGSELWRAEAHLAQARLNMFYGRFVESESETRIALELARKLGEHELLWKAREMLVQTLMRLGKLDDGKAELDVIRADVEAGDVRGREVLAIALVRLGVATQDPKIIAEARMWADRLEEEQGDVKGALVSRSELAYDLMINWNAAASRATYEASRATTKAHGIWQSYLVSTVNLGCVEREIGHYERARARWAEILPMAKRLDVMTSMSCCRLNLAELDLATGKPEQAVKEAREGVRLARKSGIRSDLAEGLVTLGAAEWSTGAAKNGLAHLEEGLALRRSLNSPRFLARELCTYVETMLAAGEREKAAEAGVELRELFDKNPERQIAPGRIALALAAVAESAGDEATARKVRLRGRKAVEFALSRMTDPEDRAAFSAIEHNRMLLESPQ